MSFYFFQFKYLRYIFKILFLIQEHARRRQGAIIESMHHHGKGVYSGTFSGTLNPALQDRHGRPKRDISTIIHILNDLLCATPAASTSHYRHHHRHSSSRQQSSPTSPSGSTSTPCGLTSPNGTYQDSSPTSEYSIGIFLNININFIFKLPAEKI